MMMSFAAVSTVYVNIKLCFLCTEHHQGFVLFPFGFDFLVSKRVKNLSGFWCINTESQTLWLKTNHLVFKCLHPLQWSLFNKKTKMFFCVLLFLQLHLWSLILKIKSKRTQNLSCLSLWWIIFILFNKSQSEFELQNVWIMFPFMKCLKQTK